MRRIQSVRLLLLSSFLLAIAVQMTWVTQVDDAAGVRISSRVTGHTALPILDALLLINLVMVLALLVLPWWGSAAVVVATVALGLTAVARLWGAGEYACGPRLLALAGISLSLVSCWAARLHLRPHEPPRQPDRATGTRIDRWRALDAGEDPTIDE